MVEKSGMIDVGSKKKTKRQALAEIKVLLPAGVIVRIKNDQLPKGNVLETARVAGILAAKKTDEWIPLCHTLELDSVKIEFHFDPEGVRIRAMVNSTSRTGVEMEALTACSAAALTVYDMCKMFSKSIVITDLFLLEKKGGRSGHYVRRGQSHGKR